jgi:hypothetical protein
MSYRQGFSQGQSMTGKVGIGVVALGVNCKKTILVVGPLDVAGNGLRI